MGKSRNKVIIGVLCTALLLAGCGVQKKQAEKEPHAVSGGVQTQADTDAPDTAAEDMAAQLPGTGKTVAVCMPTQDATRWVADADNMKNQLEAEGYTVRLAFSGNDARRQAVQLQQFVRQQVDCVVVAAIDSDRLIRAERRAKAAGIPVIAYDRLLMDTDAVSYYATFDNREVGRLIGQGIAAHAKLEELEDGEYRTIEFFMGSADDNNAYLVYEGMMEVLEPYLADGRLVCRSGRTSFADTTIDGWSQKKAQARCRRYLTQFYTQEDIDICAAACDGFAYGCRAALQKAGYVADNWPVISGQDCEPTACKYILEGTQSFSVHKDTRVLAGACAAMVDAVCGGREPDLGGMTQYDNGKRKVPAYECVPLLVDADNLQETLVESGYYTSDELD